MYHPTSHSWEASLVAPVDTIHLYVCAERKKNRMYTYSHNVSVAVSQQKLMTKEYPHFSTSFYQSSNFQILNALQFAFFSCS
jgi:hypothetical protein